MENVNIHAMILLNGFYKNISSQILFYNRSYNWDIEFPRSDSTGFTGFHGITDLGIVEITVSLLQMRIWGPNNTDVEGNIEFLLVIRRGHEAIVNMVLARGGVTPNLVDKNGRKPLLWAADYWFWGSPAILLQQEDVAPNIADESGLIPLIWALQRGHEDIIKMLLERKDITLITADKMGRLHLCWAAYMGSNGATEMVFKRGDVAPNTVEMFRIFPSIFHNTTVYFFT